ncbi:diguanylate cyclase [Saccharobesus litoralis]|uniref:diguanylate cyclase n=1 Tax=Saccharobesus litoralis TaxID=2172099 RepID=UPI00131F222E|nr:diguanylate cyclase [Saccharobesus litoralis]
MAAIALPYNAFSLELTNSELTYLQKTSAIKMCVDPDWMPYERINQFGHHEGIAADYLSLVAKRLNIQVKLVRTHSWAQTLEFAKQRRCDIISMARKTADRQAYFNFTQPYITYPFVVATLVDQPFIESFDLIADKTIAAVKGYAVTEHLKLQYPTLNLIEVANIDEGIQLVREKKSFAYVDSALAIGYKIQQSATLDIKVSGQLHYSSSPSIAVRNDEPLLVNVIDKALASITKEERQAIYNTWVSIRFEKGFDYSLALQVLLLVGSFLILSLYWNRRLIKANEKTRKAVNELNAAKTLLEEKNASLEQLATVDMLTGLHNRLKIEESFEVELNRYDRFHSVFSVILLDLDNFKQVNDEYGHLTGDLILVEFAKLLKTHTRNMDFVGRWGGEEFIILCPETDLIGAEFLADKIRFEVEQFSFPEVGHKTCSLGVTTIREGDSQQDIVLRADQALYKAKGKGKNLVELN